MLWRGRLSSSISIMRQPGLITGKNHEAPGSGWACMGFRATILHKDEYP